MHLEHWCQLGGHQTAFQPEQKRFTHMHVLTMSRRSDEVSHDTGHTILLYRQPQWESFCQGSFLNATMVATPQF